MNDNMKQTIKKKILDLIKIEDSKKTRISCSDWRVLVVDKFTMRMISACVKMHELVDRGITLVEDIMKNREPLPALEAIYILTPTEDSINHLIQDFKISQRPRYKAAHVFFTHAIPDILFEKINGQRVVNHMKACKEINIAFVPHENQAFSLDFPESFQLFYSPKFLSSKQSLMEKTADQIATLCSVLGEFPSIRYRKDWKQNIELVQLVRTKLDEYKSDDPTMGQGSQKANSTLLILDRGFDCVSPLVHELTLQAMMQDLLPISNDVYKFQQGGNSKEFLLDDTNEMWQKLRYKHIADVTAKLNQYMIMQIDGMDKLRKKVVKHMPAFPKQVQEKCAPLLKSQTKGIEKNDEMLLEVVYKHYSFLPKEVQEDFNPLLKLQKRIADASSRDLALMPKIISQWQQYLSNYSMFLQLTEDCMKKYAGLDKLCMVEQDLAMGTDSDGEKIEDFLRLIAPVVLDDSVSRLDKVRIIALYVMIKNGISKHNFAKLVNDAEIMQNEIDMITNLSCLGASVFLENDSKQKFKVPRKDRSEEQPYLMSRWTPVIKDIMELCIADKLDPVHFPFEGEKRPNVIVAKSARFGNWRTESDKPKIASRLIIFIVGGMSFSEMRCAYEVTKAFENWDVIVGSTHILTPNSFMKNLETVSKE